MDDVLVPAHATVRVGVALAVAPDGATGRWRFPSHILEHADNGSRGELERDAP